jgi:prepilin-type N-terminal cleavage/methylation domain-containing protein
LFRPALRSSGFTLIELLAVLLVLLVLSSLSYPAFRHWTHRLRARGALDLVAGELYRARMMAVESGGTSRLTLHADAFGCVRSVTVTAVRVAGGGTSPPTPRAFGALDLPGLCLRHSGDPTFVFNSRGMLRPPARSLSVHYRGGADSLVISTAGRVRRAYRRRPGPAKRGTAGEGIRV